MAPFVDLRHQTRNQRNFKQLELDCKRLFNNRKTTKYNEQRIKNVQSLKRLEVTVCHWFCGGARAGNLAANRSSRAIPNPN